MLLRKILLIVLISAFVLSVMVYGYYKALPLFLGPKIELSSPNSSVNEVSADLLTIIGNVFRAKALYINGVPTSFTEAGHFETVLPLFTGVNLIHIQALDNFGRSTEVVKSIGLTKK